MSVRARALVRLGVLLAVLTTLFIVGTVIGLEPLRGALEHLGPLAPIAFVVLSSALGALLVPGPVLAALSGAMFGPLTGAICSTLATVGSAIIATSLSRRASGDSIDGITGPRSAALVALVRRNALLAVIAQRLIPGISDAAASHAFGALGVRVRTVALGAALTASPRAFGYALIGANADDVLGPGALLGWGINAAMGIVGVTVAVVVHRRTRRPAAEPPD